MSSEMYRINEIFYSLQGEGFHTGTPVVFVRFSGCNLRCPFCDTDFEQYTLCSAEDICRQVEKLIRGKGEFPTPSILVILTGGEPSLQADERLISALHQLVKTICIETNGTHALPESIDWITCSPKEGSKVVLKEANEVKVVYTGQDVEPWQRQISAQHYFLQPCSCQNTQETIEYILEHPTWRLSLQTHKLTGVR